MHDISIVNPRLNPAMFPKEFALKNKAVALIEPVCNTILIDERVARIRALRGFGPRSRDFRKGALLTGEETDLAVTNAAANSEAFRDSPRLFRYFERRAKVEESERQIAEVNISHDGNAAVAVCMALDQPVKAKGERIIDDGKWLPVHEPQWGDEGWFSKDNIFMDNPSEGEVSVNSDEYKDAMDGFFKQRSERKIPFLP